MSSDDASLCKIDDSAVEAAPSVADSLAPPRKPLLDPNRVLDYGLDNARFFDLPRTDGMPREKAHLNQYFYSEHTASRLALEISLACPVPARVAYICTPTLFFARPDSLQRPGDVLLEIDDDSFGALTGFVHFDLAAPEELPERLRGAFDMAVLDPPLISAEAWQLSSRAAAFLLDSAGPRRLLATTVAGNAPMLARLFPGMVPARFLPDIPHLVHAFRSYTNYAPLVLDAENEQVPGDGRELPPEAEAAETREARCCSSASETAQLAAAEREASSFKQ